MIIFGSDTNKLSFLDFQQHKERKTAQQTKIETSIERAKDILLSDILGTNKSTKLSMMKRVRLSVDTKMISPMYTPRISSLSNNSGQEHLKLNLSDYKPTLKATQKKSDNESLEEYIQRSTSSRNSTLSQKSVPQLVLDHIDNEKIWLKHNTHTIEIEIIKLELCENSALLDDNNANFLYVEYSFMNYKGYLLETQSLPKPKKSRDSTAYNMIRKFDINAQNKDFKHFKAMVDKKTNTPIKFLIVSEPIDAEDDDDDGGNCDEVGFACIKLNKVIEQSKSNTENIVADCFSIAYPHELIAYLHVKITGIDVLKKLSMLK
ncbi:hypothetical protein ACKWTF_004077 [Chironomus riparius]